MLQFKKSKPALRRAVKLRFNASLTGARRLPPSSVQLPDQPMTPSPTKAASHTLPTRLCARALLLLLSLPVAACSNVDRTVATSSIPADYHSRHPVALVNARQSLDIFLIGGGRPFDYRQKHDIEAFSADYRAHGEGLIRVLVPRGAVDEHAADGTLTAVRRALAAAEVRSDIEVGYYRVTDANLASSLQLSFVKLQARAVSHCGDWPQDLNSGASLEGWENRTYYNLGCATQQTLAAQMDDPRDLVRPRTDDPSDVQMRTRAIKDIRGDTTSATPVGQDPSTVWGYHILSSGSLGVSQ